jgi:hypothetical protein
MEIKAPVHWVSRGDSRYTLCQAKISKLGVPALSITITPEAITCYTCKERKKEEL